MDTKVTIASSTEEKCSFHKKPLFRFLLTIIIDILIPLGLYFGCQYFLDTVYAMIIAGVPPLVLIIIKFLRFRTFDAFGFIACLTFVISAVIGFTTEDPRTLLLGQALTTAMISCIFGLTLIPFERYCSCSKYRIRPLVFYSYQDIAPFSREKLGLPESIFQNVENQEILSKKQEIAQVYEWLYVNCSPFKRSCLLMTLVWFIGLFLNFLGQLIPILLHLSTDTIVVSGRILMVSITILCVLLTIICAKRGGKQMRAALETWKKEHTNVQ